MNKDVVIQNLKKHKVPIIFGVIALLAAVSIFYPLAGMQDDLRGQSDKDAQNYGQLDQLKKAKFEEPRTDPFKTEATPLKVWPVPVIEEAGEAAMKELERLSKSLYEDLWKLNDHSKNVLVTGVLPLPKTQSLALAFAPRYLKVLSHDPDMTGKVVDGATPDKDLTDPECGPPAMNLYNDVLQGGLPPTLNQIIQRRNDLFHNKYEIRYRRQGDVVINKDEINKLYLEEAGKLNEGMKLEIAQKKKMYVATDALLARSDIKIESTPTPDQMWFAQMSLWVQQDLCDGLAKANADKTNIIDARVKQLVAIRVPAGSGGNNDSFYVIAPADGQQAGGAPGQSGFMPSPKTETQKLDPNYTKSPTGRNSNAMYDVVGFSLVIDVDATQVKQVIKSLCDNKLITITNQSMYVLDMTKQRSAGYIYGNGTMVRLVLEGEALYMRPWTVPLMPPAVKAAMGISIPGPGGAAGQMGGGNPGGGNPGGGNPGGFGGGGGGGPRFNRER
jgi:hypothetical protein